MKAMNLYLLTRAAAGGDFSLLAKELTGAMHKKEYSRHEAESLRSLTDELVPHLREKAPKESSWLSFLDGFYYSFTIAHISKEFDLLKISAGSDSVLNIELKSEAIAEDRILKQLAQNRYYLSHISKMIFSYSYVMETKTLYCLNDKGYMRVCEMSDLAEVLCRPVFSDYVEKDLDQYFRASDYLISPVAAPEKYLQGHYFLTNQQAEFKRRILETLSEEKKADTASPDDGKESERTDRLAPLISVSGSAGTGKTLLLFDLVMHLSRKKKVLFLHGGKLQSGHKVIDDRLRNVEIFTADSFTGRAECAYLFVDEANRIPADAMDTIIRFVRSQKVPCIMAHDPHVLTGQEEVMVKAEERIRDLCTLSLEFTGNIRINRPVYSFMRELFFQKERPAAADYSCIDVLFAKTRQEAKEILAYYKDRGYHKITLPGGGVAIGRGLSADEIVGLEFDKVVVILDSRFYYDDEKRLHVRGEVAEETRNLLYEGISRTREKLCLLIFENEEIFAEILAIRER